MLFNLTLVRSKTFLVIKKKNSLKSWALNSAGASSFLLDLSDNRRLIIIICIVWCQILLKLNNYFKILSNMLLLLLFVVLFFSNYFLKHIFIRLSFLGTALIVEWKNVYLQTRDPSQKTILEGPFTFQVGLFSMKAFFNYPLICYCL